MRLLGKEPVEMPPQLPSTSLYSKAIQHFRYAASSLPPPTQSGPQRMACAEVYQTTQPISSLP